MKLQEDPYFRELQNAKTQAKAERQAKEVEQRAKEMERQAKEEALAEVRRLQKLLKKQ